MYNTNELLDEIVMYLGQLVSGIADLTLAISVGAALVALAIFVKRKH